VKEPNPRRFALWAASLVLPLVLGGLLLPGLRRWAAGPDKVAAARDAVRAAEGAASAQARAADAVAGEGASADAAPPRAPELPSDEAIQRAHDSAVALGRSEQRGLEGAVVLAPGEAAPDGRESVRPFDGFGLSIDSSPAGARVRLDGREAGLTPLLTSVDCSPGDAIAVAVEARGRKAHRRTVVCRKDALVSFTVTLAR